MKLYHLDNQQILQYLMLNRMYPGTIAYKQIKFFFQRYSRQNRSIFYMLDQKFGCFLKTIYELYFFLLNKNIEGEKIIRLRDHLIDLFCWLILNEIAGYKHITHQDFLDYTNSKYFQDIHSHLDVNILSEAIEYYHSMIEYVGFDKNNIPQNQKMQFESIVTKLIQNQSFGNYCSDPGIKSIINLSKYTGLSIEGILKIKQGDLNMFHQNIKYSGKYSARRLKIVFEQNVKKILIENIMFSRNIDYLFFTRIDGDINERLKYFKNRLEFELKNARMIIKTDSFS